MIFWFLHLPGLYNQTDHMKLAAHVGHSKLMLKAAQKLCVGIEK